MFYIPEYKHVEWTYWGFNYSANISDWGTKNIKRWLLDCANYKQLYGACIWVADGNTPIALRCILGESWKWEKATDIHSKLHSCSLVILNLADCLHKSENRAVTKCVPLGGIKCLENFMFICSLYFKQYFIFCGNVDMMLAVEDRFPQSVRFSNKFHVTTEQLTLQVLGCAASAAQSYQAHIMTLLARVGNCLIQVCKFTRMHTHTQSLVGVRVQKYSTCQII